MLPHRASARGDAASSSAASSAGRCAWLRHQRIASVTLLALTGWALLTWTTTGVEFTNRWTAGGQTPHRSADAGATLTHHHADGSRTILTQVTDTPPSGGDINTLATDAPKSVFRPVYCIVHSGDLAVPHSRCFNSTRAGADVHSTAAAFSSRYPCIPIELEFDTEAAMHDELGVADEAERRRAIIVLRGGETSGAASDTVDPLKSDKPTAIALDVLRREFLRQHYDLHAPRPIFPPGEDPNALFTSDAEARRKAAGGDAAPPPYKEAPAIARQDLLLFHDRLSWTLFVQSISGRDGARAIDGATPASSSSGACPLDLTPFGGEYIFARSRHDTKDTADPKQRMCLPHHELLFGPMRSGATKERRTADAASQHSVHTCHSCDAHGSSRHLLVPYELFHSTVSELVCRPDVHSLLDVMLGIQDENELCMAKHHAHNAAASSPPDSAERPSSPAASSSMTPAWDWTAAWNRIGPDGTTPYWNAHKAYFITDSDQEFVEPSSYYPKPYGDTHEEYPEARSDEPKMFGGGVKRESTCAPLRVVCCSIAAHFSVPGPPPLHVRSPAFHHLHDSFPPSAEYLDLSRRSAQGRPLPDGVLVDAPTPNDLSTFRQPQSHVRPASWTSSRFAGWVDVQRQGEFVCPGCVLRWDFCRYVSGKEEDGRTAADHPYWAATEYFACALAGDRNGWPYTEKGAYLEHAGYIARVTPTPHTPLEHKPSLERRMIKRVVYSDLHVSWHGCNPSKPVCCDRGHALYPLHCRNARQDSLWMQSPPCCLRQLFNMYHFFLSLFEKHNVEWSLACGSLLTALRSDGGANPYDFDVDFMLYRKGAEQVRALFKEIHEAGYLIFDEWDPTNGRVDKTVFRVIRQSPDHLHQSTIDIYLQGEEEAAERPFNETTMYLGRRAHIPFRAEAYLDGRYPGWRETQVLRLENWGWDPVKNKRTPWLYSSLREIRRPFNRTMEVMTLPPWARRMHAYAEWDLSRAGVDRRDEQEPTIDIVWRPGQM